MLLCSQFYLSSQNKTLSLNKKSEKIIDKLFK